MIMKVDRWQFRACVSLTRRCCSLVVLRWAQKKYTGSPIRSKPRPMKLSRGAAQIWLTAMAADVRKEMAGKQRIGKSKKFGRVLAAPMQQKNARSQQRKEQPFGIDHPAKKRAIRICGGQDARPHGLRGDREIRSLAFGMERSHPSESEAVLRHGVIDARAGQRNPVERTERGNDNHHRDRLAARQGPERAPWRRRQRAWKWPRRPSGIT